MQNDSTDRPPDPSSTAGIRLAGLKNTPTKGKQLTATQAEVIEVLEEARSVIGIFHGREGWGEYQNSPEITRLDALLAKLRSDTQASPSKPPRKMFPKKGNP